MEVFQTDDHYIILDGEHSLWCSRRDGTLEPKTGNDLCSAWNPVCIGLTYGVVGKIKIHPESDWKLLLISKQTCVGQLCDEHEVYQVNKVALLSLTDAELVDVELDRCLKHHFGIKKTERITSGEDQGNSLQKTWNIVKTAAENVKPKKREVKDKEKFERRILEELIKLYNETNSFYYCKTYDLTNTVQRQYHDDYRLVPTIPLWRCCDERFFWNKHMVTELAELDSELRDHWIVPLIQGCVDIQTCPLDFSEGGRDLSPMMPPQRQIDKDPISYTLVVISRRSRHRAGTRSKRRGLDETGSCSNYVETEQIIEFSHHRVSFVQVRGSIPVYWSQTGVKYRPPPKLDKGVAETYEAFRKHFDEQLDLYTSLVVITLAELTGKEKAIGDAFLNNVLKYNSHDVTYVTFDFHEYCRGMKFENVSVLTSGIKDIIKHMRYCWVDRKGMICEQRGVFRINCVDCLDRTNVVQTAIARIVMETQCRKLGLLAPEENLPENCRRVFQQTWANTGDAVSKQYAGTAALKGDFTRTGERKISGMMKDGVNSANRYYLRFKDTYRQAAIDLTHGKPVSEDILSGRLKVPDDDVREMVEKEENMKMLVEDCKKMLIIEPEECLGGWCLINADPMYGDPDRQEMDIILLLSQRAVYVAWYSDEEEQVTMYQRIFLEDIEKIEIGSEPSLFKSKNVVMRLHYRHYADEGFFHTFRVTGTRLFNNLVIPVKTVEEAREQLSVVCQAFAAAQNILSLTLTIEEKAKLDKKKTQIHPEIMDIHQQLQENSLAKIKLPRDISATDIPRSGSRGNSPLPSRRRLSPVVLRRQLSPGEGGEHTQNIREESKGSAGDVFPTGADQQKPKFFQKLSKASAGAGKSLDLVAQKVNIKSLNLVGKIRSGRAGAEKLLAKVPGSSMFYKHGDEGFVRQIPPSSAGTVRAEGPSSQVDAVSRREARASLSKDDSSLDESFEITESDLQKEVVLDSCGILATNAKHIIESPQYSLEVSDDEHGTDGRKPEETAVESKEVPAASERRGRLKRTTDDRMSRSNPFDGVSDLDANQYVLDQTPRLEVSDFPDGLEEGNTDEKRASFTCFCPEEDVCNQGYIEAGNVHEDIWMRRHDATEARGKMQKSLDLNLGQMRVIDNSEADQILDKYSKTKKSLTHPNMRNSLSDSALSTNLVTVQLDNFSGDSSPKSVLEIDFEMNAELQKKLPNLLQNARMPRKCHRVYDALKSHIEEQLGDKPCQSTIIFI